MATLLVPLSLLTIPLAPVQAAESDQPSFGSCPVKMYLSQGGPTALLEVDNDSNPFKFKQIGSNTQHSYNSTAFNPVDGYLYGLTYHPDTHLLRIGSDGSITDLGAIMAKDLPDSSMNTGEFDKSGNYYVKEGGRTNEIWKIDIATRTATPEYLSQEIATADWAISNGILYAHDRLNGNFYSIDLDTYKTTTIGQSGITGNVGAMAGTPNGIYGSANAGGFYQFDLETGEATMISDSPSSNSNDGAKCPDLPFELPADLAITKDDGQQYYTPGETLTYTIAVSNGGPFGAQGARVIDPLPEGITKASWSCKAGKDAKCGAASGTGAIDTEANLSPGSSITYTMTMTVPGNYTRDTLENTAEVRAPIGSPDKDTSNNTASDSNTIDSEYWKPGISLAKTGELNGRDNDDKVDPGETIDYKFVVRNTGNVTLTMVTVDDPLVVGKITPDPQILAPGERATFTARYAPTQADIDRGEVANTATATGNDPGNNRVTSAPSGYTVATDNRAELSLAKTGKLNDGDGDGKADTDETIDYRFVVENTGNVTMTGVTVDDPLVTGKITPGPQTLAPGETAAFTARYAPTQTDINSGSIRNSAKATGETPDKRKVSSPVDQVNISTDNHAGIILKKRSALKDGDGDGRAGLGEIIDYSFVIENSGNVPLTGVTVEDRMISIREPARTLDLDQNLTFTGSYTVTQEDVDKGEVVNRASASGDDPQGETIKSPSDTTIVETAKPAPGLTLEKTGTLDDQDGNKLVNRGETIDYEFLVTNTGNVTLTGVTIDDALVTIDQAPQDIAPGKSFTFRASYTARQEDIDNGEVVNTATANGSAPDGRIVTSEPDEAVTPPERYARLRFVKVGTLDDEDNDNLVDEGEAIDYVFTVTNAGNVTLHDVTIDDPLVAGTITPGPQTLAPGNSIEFKARYVADQGEIDGGGRVTNRARATGEDRYNGRTVESPEASARVPLDDQSGLSISKSAVLKLDEDGDGKLDIGEIIGYTFMVENTGNVTLTEVTVDDPPVSGSIIPTHLTLTPGETAAFKADYKASQADIDNGRVVNTARAVGKDPQNGTVVSSADRATVIADTRAALVINKSAVLHDDDDDGKVDFGEAITYRFSVENTGKVTLTGVAVDDPLLKIDQEPRTLAPSEVTRFEVAYEPTQEDIDNGEISNRATAFGAAPDGTEVTSSPDRVTLSTDRRARLSLMKTGRLNDGDGDGKIDLGETIDYGFAVENTGTVTMTEILVDDPLVRGRITPGQQVLAPGEKATFTARYTPTQEDIDRGRVVNTATAEGRNQKGETISSPPSSVTTHSDTRADLELQGFGELRDTDGDGRIDPGEAIEYRFEVTNTGTATIIEVTIDSPLVGGTIIPEPQTLAPGETATFTAVYTPTQEDIDRGEVTSTAVATSTDPRGDDLTSPPATVTVPPDDHPDLKLRKTARLNDKDSDRKLDRDESVIYEFMAENTGNLTLHDVTIDDPLVAGKITPGPQTLAPGESSAFTAIYRPTQNDIDAGEVINIANAAGRSPDGGTIVSLPDSARVPTDRDASVQVELRGTLDDANGNGIADAGEQIIYEILVRNPGNASLSGIVITGSSLDITGGPIPSLRPGETNSGSFRATYRLTEEDIGKGEIIRQVMVSAGTPDRELVTDISDDPNDPADADADGNGDPDDMTRLPLRTAIISIVKSGRYEDSDGNGHANEGDVIHYLFDVTNNGTLPLEDVAPVDRGPDFAGHPGAGHLSAFSPASTALLVGATQRFSSTYTLAQSDIGYAAEIADAVSNRARAQGYANGGQAGGWPVQSAESRSVLTLPAGRPDISLVKIARQHSIRRGEQVLFTIRLVNNAAWSARGMMVTDTVPPGFRFAEGSASVNGEKVTPVISGRKVIFEDLVIPGGAMLDIDLRLLALGSAGPGDHVNLAMLTGRDGKRLAPDARASVEILAEPVFDCSGVVGKIFDDRNRNGSQDAGETGLPGARLATVEGWLVTTDAFGRFHVSCAMLPDPRIGSNFIIKLDERSLPIGYEPTTENPRVVRLTAGKVSVVDFGVSAGRAVRLDVTAEAFEPGRIRLRPEWIRRLEELVDILGQEEAVLKLGYAGTGNDPGLAERRIDNLKALIIERWRLRGQDYPLAIETQLEIGK